MTYPPQHRAGEAEQDAVLPRMGDEVEEPFFHA